MKKSILCRSALAAMLVVTFVFELPVHAEATKNARSTRSTPAVGRKNIEFEEGVVEGLGKRGKDSLSQVGDNDGRNRPRLYKKRLHFKEEMNEVYQEMEYSR